jgi:argininosuccinate lyase
MKLWGGRFTGEENKLMEDFNSSLSFDKTLYEMDLIGSMAHVAMLSKCGILTEGEGNLITEGLVGIKKDIDEGILKIEGDYEDIHSFVESNLIARIGEVAKKLHTSRSRNDQVAVDTRLYARNKAYEVIDNVQALIDVLVKVGEENDIIMPGYTHLQRAQIVTIKYYLGAYVSMFKRDKKRLENTADLLNECPLGCGALAGSTYNIDRKFTADQLEFKKPVDNFLDGVSDRDFLIELLSDFSIIMMHLSRLSEELILWSSKEFSFVSMSDAYSTGSSLMPQKKNPDATELVRGKTGRVYGSLMGLLTTMKGLPLAYNKDMQEDKEGFFDSLNTVLACLQIMQGVIGTLKFNKDKMENAVGAGFLNATELADYLVCHGVAFRNAHGIVGKVVIYCEEHNKKIEELELEELKKFDPVFEKDVYDFIAYKNILNRGIKREML